MTFSKINIKIVSVEETSFQHIKERVAGDLEILKLQTYFPILDLYFDFYNNSKRQFTLKSKFRIKNIIEKLHHTIDDSYIKHFFKCTICDIPKKRDFECDIFVKIMPLLNVIHYLTENYNVNNDLLPNKFNLTTTKKINNCNNSAYIDVFFSHLGSILTEKGRCPTFPLFYGTFSGIKDNFKFDITEDYDDLKDNNSFKKGLGFEYELEDIELEKEHVVNEQLLNSQCDIELSSMSDDDDIELSAVSDNDAICSNNLDTLEYVNNMSISAEADVLHDNHNSHDIHDSHDNHDIHDSHDSHDNHDRIVVSDSSNEWDDEDDEDDEDGEDGEDDEDDEDDEDNLVANKTFSQADLSNIRALKIDETMSDISASTNKSNVVKYVIIPQFPVQINCIEKLEYTLDNYIDMASYKKIPPTEWKSILFQVCFGLSVAQKEFEFIHNDLHSSNIMFKTTQNEYLYYSFNNTYFRIPTFNKISKIIDFGRATFKVNNKLFFSDVFKKNEDAGGQYSYPFQNTLKHCKIKPNKSFDLSRLATTIMHRFSNLDDSYKDITELLHGWTTDKYGNDLMCLEEDFDLYKTIAKNVHSANPKTQLYKKIWDEFRITKEDIPDGVYIYRY